MLLTDTTSPGTMATTDNLKVMESLTDDFIQQYYYYIEIVL